MYGDGDFCRILQLSDCTMIYLLSFLDSTSLFNLSRTCLYFKNIIEDPRLWQYIDARSEPNSTKKVEYICERVCEKTTTLLLKAESKYNGNVPEKYFSSWMDLENLLVLSLENQRFDGKHFCLLKFPKSLRELSLRKSHIKNGGLFFHSSCNRMRNLKVLILDECNWVDSNFLISVAKYENLEVLSLVKCQKLHFNVMPYLSVAKHGFKRLKVIDTRYNTIGNEVLRTFNSHPPLLALYCQSMRSYELDKDKPLLENVVMKIRNQHILHENIIKNESLEQFLHFIGGSYEELPKTELYQDPYGKCTCGYRENLNRERASLKRSPTLHMQVDDFFDLRPLLQKVMCRKHMGELNKLPQCSNIVDVDFNVSPSDSSHSDSDSDDDTNCCMFGMENKKQIIVLKVRETDEQGNMPAPEVLDISEYVRFSRRNKTNGNSENDNSSSSPENPQPGPSRLQSDDVIRSPGPSTSCKRKTSEQSSGINQKKHKTADGSARVSDESDASDDESDQRAMGDAQAKNEDTKTDRNSSNSQRANQLPPNRPSIAIHRNNGVVVIRPQRYPRPYQLPQENPIFVDIFGPRLRNPYVQVYERKRQKVNLRRLSLRGYRQISDVALDFLKTINLDLLDVTYTGVTKEAILDFLSSNPNCRVVHEDFCVCKPHIPC
ncbi:uncharacterized protein LOC143193807 [Rhynchophorus ferrugineus]|uniref:F-box domain-containing protein n=1 Tax=Rhynchophorus ferrugineus TaxID=354439 RepID=A0A834MBI3_RHYFE|nr:hypothetical protein GWI33_015359 [Rhynchophorus ferrugineus]